MPRAGTQSPDKDFDVTTENIDQTFFLQKTSDQQTAVPSSTVISPSDFADTAPGNAGPLTSPMANPVFQTSRQGSKGGVRVHLSRPSKAEPRKKNNSSTSNQVNLIGTHPSVYQPHSSFRRSTSPTSPTASEAAVRKPSFSRESTGRLESRKIQQYKQHYNAAGAGAKQQLSKREQQNIVSEFL